MEMWVNRLHEILDTICQFIEDVGTRLGSIIWIRIKREKDKSEPLSPAL